ncbi:MAG: hypothetical protein FWD94_02530 [Treponema sp.]|nr:hypothetical protein [Treponema sp.]
MPLFARGKNAWALTPASSAVTLYGMDRIVKELGAINLTLTEIRDRLRKPKGKVSGLIEMAALVVTALGFFHVVDIVMRWFTGG